jgi:predicted dinucleotide-binding enzyme
MKIGTIGAGRIAKAFAKHAAEAGYEVIMSNKSGPPALTDTVKSLGPNVKAATQEEALKTDIVLLSIPWKEVVNVLNKITTWTGQIILDTTNAASFPDFKPLDLGGKASSEIVAELAKGAIVVKAFNTIEAATLASDPKECGGNRVVFISGDDVSAKKIILDLLTKMGFAGIDLGTLAESKIQQVGGPLITKNFIKLSR